MTMSGEWDVYDSQRVKNRPTYTVGFDSFNKETNSYYLTAWKNDYSNSTIKIEDSTVYSLQFDLIDNSTAKGEFFDTMNDKFTLQLSDPEILIKSDNFNGRLILNNKEIQIYIQTPTSEQVNFTAVQHPQTSLLNFLINENFLFGFLIVLIIIQSCLVYYSFKKARQPDQPAGKSPVEKFQEREKLKADANGGSDSDDEEPTKLKTD